MVLFYEFTIHHQAVYHWQIISSTQHILWVSFPYRNTATRNMCFDLIRGVPWLYVVGYGLSNILLLLALDWVESQESNYCRFIFWCSEQSENMVSNWWTFSLLIWIVLSVFRRKTDFRNFFSLSPFYDRSPLSLNCRRWLSVSYVAIFSLSP